MPFEDVKEKMAQELVKDGKRPNIPKNALHSDDPAIKTMVSVIKRCWKQDPTERPSASSIRDELKRVIDKMVMANDNSQDDSE